MRSRRSGIHVGLADSSIFIAECQLAIDGLITINGDIARMLDINAKLWVLTNIQAFFRARVWLREQILHFLVIDLDHGDGDLHLNLLGSVGFDRSDSLENLVTSSRHDALVLTIADHGVALT